MILKPPAARLTVSWQRGGLGQKRLGYSLDPMRAARAVPTSPRRIHIQVRVCRELVFFKFPVPIVPSSLLDHCLVPFSLPHIRFISDASTIAMNKVRKGQSANILKSPGGVSYPEQRSRVWQPNAGEERTQRQTVTWGIILFTGDHV